MGDQTDAQSASNAQRALKVLARSVFKELKRGGYSRHEMVGFATELLDLVTAELRADSADEAAAE